MYCPNCAAPIDGVKYCRSCGANVSLVSQALTGELPMQTSEEEKGSRGKRGRHKQPSIEKAATRFFTGIGFFLAAPAVMFYFPAGFTWGWALLIPAFACLGEGIGQYLRLRELQRQQLFQSPIQPVIQPKPDAPEISAPTTSNLSHPTSVTENTTRNLDPSRQRK